MSRHDGCGHGPGTGWTLEATVRWLARCDTCGRIRLQGHYFEVYGGKQCWWWECGSCLFDTITNYAEAKARESADRRLSLEEALGYVAQAGRLARVLEFYNVDDRAGWPNELHELLEAHVSDFEMKVELRDQRRRRRTL